MAERLWVWFFSFSFLKNVRWSFAYMYVCVRMSHPLNLELQDSGELPCGCQELNASPLEEQPEWPVLLTGAVSPARGFAS